MKCSICFLKIRKNPEFAHDKHVFHKSCLSKWQGGREVFPCPLCRKELGVKQKEERLAAERMAEEAFLAQAIATAYFAGGVAVRCLDPSKDWENGSIILFGVSWLLVLSVHLKGVVTKMISSYGRLHGA